MEAVFKIKADEFNSEIVEIIRNFLSHVADAEVMVTIKKSEPIYSEKLLRSKEELENGTNLISFTMEELEAYTASKQV